MLSDLVTWTFCFPSARSSVPLHIIVIWLLGIAKYYKLLWAVVVAWLDCWVVGWFLVVGDRVSLCGPGCPGTLSVDQAGLQPTEIHLPLLPKYWD